MTAFVPLHDGGFTMERDLFPALASRPKDWEALLGGPAPRTFDIPVWAFAIRCEDGWTLVDTGGGRMMGVGFGGVAMALKAAGIEAKDVARIHLTHLHGDHCGGLIEADGAAAFPAARVALSEAEMALWTGPDVPRGMERISDDARRALAPYHGRIDLVAPGDRIGGADAVAARGHTPGHMAWAFRAPQLLAVGDILHLAPLQLARPDLGSIWDMDADAACETRRRLIRWAQETGATLLCAHGGAIQAAEDPR